MPYLYPMTQTINHITAGSDHGYRLAWGVGVVVNPFILPVLLFPLFSAQAGAPAEAVGRAGLIGLTFFAAIPIAYLFWMVRRGRTATIEVRDRTRRYRPFVVGIAAAAAAVPLFWQMDAPGAPLLAALAACITLNAVLLLAVTLRWKISIHAAAITGFSVMLLGAALMPGEVVRTLYVPVWFCLVPLVMWARVRTRAHTPRQVVAGALFGLVVPGLEMIALAHLGLLPLP
jgi:membrane-associated phospholipid phosphatase